MVNASVALVVHAKGGSATWASGRPFGTFIVLCMRLSPLWRCVPKLKLLSMQWMSPMKCHEIMRSVCIFSYVGRKETRTVDSFSMDALFEASGTAPSNILTYSPAISESFRLVLTVPGGGGGAPGAGA